MKTKLFTVLFLAVSNAFLLNTVEEVFGSSSNKQFIYGKVTTKDGDTYKGQIRWGKEEAFWFDFFNSTKMENDNLKWLSKSEEQALKGDQSSSYSWWGGKNKNSWNYSIGTTHVFACQFGDIKTIHVKKDERVFVEFKNGEKYELDGGSNDIGAQVQVSDADLGLIKLDWHRIDKVEFMDTPNDLKSTFGNPLYGVVKTIRGEFEGYLQWDHDERLSHDVLNGKSNDGEMDIEFGNIRSIERSHRGSLVTLKSGRTVELRGSNDVNDENRGIIVSTPNYGRVNIPWEEFEKMEIFDDEKMDGKSYKDYNGSKPLKGVVSTFENENIAGRLVFDLDETYQLEMLDGESDDIEYFIPFSAIKSVEPKNRKESLVTLTNGENFILGEKVDVSENNDGILVFSDSDKPRYVPWSNIKNITFDK